MSFRARFRHIIQKLAPSLHARVQQRWGDGGLDVRIDRALVAYGFNGRILSGPFKQMKYVAEARGSNLPAKLLGCYERELHPVIEACFARAYSQMIDIGCAEGYYAVGMAFADSNIRIKAFDVDPRAQELCGELARLNNVADRVTIGGRCSAESLNSIDLHNTLIICDCESAELEILNPTLAPALNGCDLLVELHDFIRPGLTNELMDRFAATHDIQLISSEPREVDTEPALRSLTKSDQIRAIAERPCPMQWAWMKTKQREKMN